jgi:tetratricopeptide (TPR) repeat protein
MKKRQFAAIMLCSLALCSCSQSPQALVKKGNDLLKGGKYEEASINFRKAIQKDGNFGEAYHGLAQVEFRLNHIPDGYRLLSRAVELMPQRADVQVELADFLLLVYMADQRKSQVTYEQLQKLSDRLMANNPKSTDGLRIRGYLALTDRKPHEAANFFQQAYAMSPGDRKLVVPLSQALVQDNRAAESETVAKRFIETDKAYGVIYDSLYLLYVNTNRPTEAERILIEKVRNNPKQPEFRMQLALHYARANRRAEMQSTLSEMLSTPADFPNAHMQVGDFYYTTQAFDDAIRTFQDGIKASPSQKLALEKRIIQALLTQRKTGDASKLLDQMVVDYPKDESVSQMRARLQLDSGKREAVQAAIQTFQAAVSNNPKNGQALYDLGRALLSKGDREGAIKQFREYLRIDPKNQNARLYLASASVELKNYKEAIAAADEVLAVDAANSRAIVLKSVALMELKKYAEARALLSQAISAHPAFLDAQLQLGLLDIAEKKFREADDIFGKFYQPGQGDLRPLSGMVESRVAQNQFGAAIQLLTNYLKAAPNSDGARLALASTYMRAAQYESAIEQLKILLKTAPNSFDLHVRAGQAWLMKGDLAQSIQEFKKSCELAANNYAVYAHLAYAQELDGQTREAVENYRRSLALKPDDPVIMNNLAFRLAEQGEDLDQSLKLAQTAQQKTNGNPAVMDTIGFVYLKKGMVDSALQVFNNLNSRYPDNPVYLYHLGMTQIKMGNNSAAKKSLEKALANRPAKPETEKIHVLMAKLS